MIIVPREPRTFHLCYGIIVADYKKKRYIVARMDASDYPLVFLREWSEGGEGRYWGRYYLYDKGLAAEEADQFLEMLKNNDTRNARFFLKKYLRTDQPLCEDRGEVVLDDMVPDIWYDCWKAMEAEITMWRDIPGYAEMDVEEQGLF